MRFPKMNIKRVQRSLILTTQLTNKVSLRLINSKSNLVTVQQKTTNDELNFVFRQMH